MAVDGSRAAARGSFIKDFALLFANATRMMPTIKSLH